MTRDDASSLVMHDVIDIPEQTLEAAMRIIRWLVLRPSGRPAQYAVWRHPNAWVLAFGEEWSDEVPRRQTVHRCLPQYSCWWEKG
jgi:hypothetical protein